MSETAVIVQEKPSLIEVLLADPDRVKDYPIEVVREMYALVRAEQAEQARREFAQAFNRVQKAMKPVRKRAKNTHTGSFYARAEHIMQMLDPLILGEGFSRSLSTSDCQQTDHIKWTLILRHVGGHEERHYMEAPIDGVGAKGAAVMTKLHGTASSGTFCERHLICKVFGVQLIADDDGNAGGGIGPGAEKITPDQVMDLQALRVEVKGDGPMLLDLMNVKRLEDIPKSEYNRAVQTLEAKRK